MAKSLGITEEAMHNEVGDIADYVRRKLNSANQDERDRPK